MTTVLIAAKVVVLDRLFTEFVTIGYVIKVCLNCGPIYCGRRLDGHPVDLVGVAYRVVIFGLD